MESPEFAVQAKGKEPSFSRRTSFWASPAAWIREKNLSREYWVFFAAAFFFDAGFVIYFFLFNLYLMDRGLSDRAIGLIGGSLTLGSVLGTLPAGALARRIGLRKMMAWLFVIAPLLNAMRVLWVWEPEQIALAFLAGIAMSAWGVCYLPAIARLTTERQRTTAYSLTFSASVGTAMLGGVVCGYLRQWIQMAGFAVSAADTKKWILLAACGLVMLGLFAIRRLRLVAEKQETSADKAWLSGWRLTPFLRRYLPLMALWSAVLAAFTPYANIYLSRNLQVPMEQVGLIFSLVQGIQLCMGLLVPVVTRMLGLVGGIAAMQATAAVVLACMAGTTNMPLAVGLYLVFSAAQWMSSPALFNLLMNETPDAERGTAAAMTLFANALAGAAATAGMGFLFTRFGYPVVLTGIAVAALAIAFVFLLVIRPDAQGRDSAPLRLH